jgi:prepilin-type N-terminal cleavage/methylation domain-containing protein
MSSVIRHSTLFPTPPPRTGVARRSGFTLIEVLVTLLLIGIVIPALMHVMTVAGTAGRDAADRNQAIELARSELAVIVAGTQWQNSNNLSGDFAPDWPNYSWKATVQPWNLDTSGMGINEIDLTVSWMQRGRETELTLSTLAYPRTSSTSGTTATN